MPEAAGDYAAGPSHVLPTGGAARFSSPLGVYDFVVRTSVIRGERDALRARAELSKVLRAWRTWRGMRAPSVAEHAAGYAGPGQADLPCDAARHGTPRRHVERPESTSIDDGRARDLVRLAVPPRNRAAHRLRTWAVRTSFGIENDARCVRTRIGARTGSACARDRRVGIARRVRDGVRVHRIGVEARSEGRPVGSARFGSVARGGGPFGVRGVSRRGEGRRA